LQSHALQVTVLRMIETRFDISSAVVGSSCAVTSSAGGELAAQAELIAFAHHVARLIVLLGPARAGAIVEALFDGDHAARHWLPGAAASGVETTVRFLDGASGPRVYFRLKAHGPLYADLSVEQLRKTLLERHDGDTSFAPRLAHVSDLMGRLGATGQVRAENEFDVALAAADVAWRSASEDGGQAGVAGLECPACEYAGARFQLRVWPSDDAVLRRCGRCGGGVWKRTGHAARSIRADVWAAMEATRAEFGDAGASTPSEPGLPRGLLSELKRVFDENDWPYSEVDGAPVLVSELSGPEGQWDFYAQAVEERDLILLYSIAPQRVPEERRREVSEFLTKANYGLADGNFELDFDDGEVRYKTVLHVQGDALDALLVRRLVRSNGTALETYLPSIHSVMSGTTQT
jgi:hypothetical protein